jgi:hypothetical protein
MENPFDAIRDAVMQARELNRSVDTQANTLVDLIDGRLQHVSAYRLKRLKQQLRGFNAHTGEWKDSHD